LCGKDLRVFSQRLADQFIEIRFSNLRVGWNPNASKQDDNQCPDEDLKFHGNAPFLKDAWPRLTKEAGRIRSGECSCFDRVERRCSEETRGVE
jgi:hypothetical protein